MLDHCQNNILNFIVNVHQSLLISQQQGTKHMLELIQFTLSGLVKHPYSVSDCCAYNYINFVCPDMNIDRRTHHGDQRHLLQGKCEIDDYC